MAELDLDAIERDAVALSPSDPSRSMLIDLVHALRRRREQAERELRHWVAVTDEVGSLKRRITELRRGFVSLAGGNCLDGVDEYKDACADELRADTARRRRFELKARKAARRG